MAKKKTTAKSTRPAKPKKKTTASTWIWPPLDLHTTNIGPARGSHHLGTITGPGLYFLVGPNTGGKTSIGRLLAQMQSQKMLGQDATISVGEVEGEIRLGPSRVTFKRVRGGKVSTRRQALNDVPPIEEIPSPIDTLITGDSLKGKEARARRRLDALLAWVPVDSDDDAVESLLEIALGTAFEDITIVEPEVVAAWGELMDDCKAKSPEALLDRDALLGLVPTDGGILTSFDWLTAKLNALGNTGEAIAARHGGRVRKAEGRVEALLEGVGAALNDALDIDIAEALEREAKDEMTRVEIARARMAEEEERRERLRERHGERPDPAEAVREWEERSGAVVEAAVNFAEALPLEPGEQEARHTALKDATAWALQALANVRSVETAIAQWERVDEEIAKPIDGPTAADLKEAREAAEEATRTLDQARAAGDWLRAGEELSRLQEIQEGLERLASDYRQAAKDCWRQLGRVVSDRLAIPWLRVDGLDIVLRYRDGELWSGAGGKGVQERSLDDEVWISTAELHEAVLKLMLERRESGSGFVILPWEVTAALDEERLEGLDRWCQDAGVAVISERPRRKGDRKGMTLDRVGEERAEVTL